MNHVSETDDSWGGLILRVVDSAVTVGIVALIVGVVLFSLFPPGSFGTTSPLDLGTPASVMTTSKEVYGPESPAYEASKRQPSNLNLREKDAASMRFQLEAIVGHASHHSENVIRTDETSLRLLAPWH